MVSTPELAATVLTGLLLLAVLLFLTRVEDWRTYVPTPGAGATTAGEEAAHGHAEKPSGVIRWLTTVDHKDIGLLYGTFSVITFFWAGGAMVLMRTELLTPETAFLEPSAYYGLLTTHGITMLFLFGTPMISAVANYFIPLLVGADDMAFPRINAIAFWLLPPGTLLIWAGFLLWTGDVEPARTGWTLYTPLSIQQTNVGVDLLLLGLHLTGVSATMGAINFIVTIFAERDVDWSRLDIFSWTMLTQSGLILFAFPLLGSALVMLLLDRNVGTTFFTVEGGSPLLWQHLFWFFGHPEVYILVLPPMGIVSLLLPRFAGRKLFGFRFVVYSTLAIGVLSFGVWAHHMFSTGIDPRLRASFMAVSLAIAVPSAVKVFNWITTMWNGSLRLTAPMLFCIGFVQNFIVGGVTGVFLASVPVDLLVHDTHYVVGHFHFIVFGAIGFALFAGIYYWFPIYAGRMYQARLAHWHFWLSIIGANIVFFALLLLGYDGMPRRYATYLPEFVNLNRAAGIGTFVMALGQVAFLWNIVTSWLEGPRIRDPDPWDLEDEAMRSAEWTWFEREGFTVPDGGEVTDGSEATDGGKATDESEVADGPEVKDGDEPSTETEPTAKSESSDDDSPE